MHSMQYSNQKASCFWFSSRVINKVEGPVLAVGSSGCWFREEVSILYPRRWECVEDCT